MSLKRYLKFFGPAWLVMIADLDASSVLGAAETGAIYRYGLIWFVLLLTVPLFFIQETAGRIGAATEKGLGELIRDNYSRGVAKLMTFPMVITDVITYAVEYIGIAIGMELLGLPIILSLPVFFMLHIIVVTRKKLGVMEAVLIAVSLLLIIAFIGSLVLRGVYQYNPVFISLDPNYFFMLAVNAGAVVMPFMLFYQSSATAEKVSRVKESLHLEEGELRKTAVKSMRVETMVGALVSELLMVIIIMTFTGVDPTLRFASASQLATALTSFAGPLAPYLFGIGLIGAAFLALVVISLGSAWGFVEAIGRKRDKALPIYVVESFPALIIALIAPAGMLVNIVLYLLVVFVFVLIGPALIMGIIARNRGIMGNFASSKRSQLIYWVNVLCVFAFGIIALA